MKDKIKNENRELEYLIWILEEKLKRTTDEELRKLLKGQLEIWNEKINKLKNNN